MEKMNEINFGIEDIIEKTPLCLESGNLTKIVDGKDTKYCTMYNSPGNSCPYLRVRDNTQICSYYQK